MLFRGDFVEAEALSFEPLQLLGHRRLDDRRQVFARERLKAFELVAEPALAVNSTL